MAEETFKTVLKAMDLAEHTLRVTSNCNQYPKKYRFSLVDKMQNKSLEIYECIMEANRTDLRYFKRERSELQTRAITYCDSVPCSLKDELPKQTNADRIRSMTDEELADFLEEVENGDLDYPITFCELCEKDGNTLNLDCKGCFETLVAEK